MTLIKNASNKIVRIIAQFIQLDINFPQHIKGTGSGVGTGFFIDNKGTILTCAHVVIAADPSKIFIEIPSKGEERFNVKLLGICPDFDLALLKLENKKTEHLILEKKGNYKPGDETEALGFPLGNVQTNLKITKGIISGRNSGLIQTDTPINPGNSGGPLIFKNKVIGINSSGILFANNIGYAVPIEKFFLVEEAMRKNRWVRRPQIPFMYHDLNSDFFNSQNIKGGCDSGVRISYVFPNSPLDKIGLKKGDIVCEINGYKVENNGLINKKWFNEKMDIIDFFDFTKNDANVKIKYWNGKNVISKNFIYSYFPVGIDTVFPIYEDIDHEIFGGMVFMNKTLNHIQQNPKDNVFNYINLDEREKSAIIISKIFEGSPVSNLNIIEPYDEVSYINGIKVSTLNDVRRALLKPVIKGRKYFVVIENSKGKQVTFNLKNLEKVEEDFSRIFRYNMTPFQQKFLKLSNKLFKNN
jgi:S1-C subfamily serine protease